MGKDNNLSMKITEHEARTNRLCPMSFNVPSPHQPPGSCWGSKCMAWRWVGKEESEKPSTGFCGLSSHFPSR